MKRSEISLRKTTLKGKEFRIEYRTISSRVVSRALRVDWPLNWPWECRVPAQCGVVVEVAGVLRE